MNGSTARFRDRQEAGEHLAHELKRRYGGRDDLIVLALPRGGVPIGYTIARALGAPLDVFVVRKLGVPGHEELAMGAIASGGVRVLNEDVVGYLNVPAGIIESVAEEEEQELRRREKIYRGSRPPLEVINRVVILVDDGLATGSTMRAAHAALKKLGPSRIVVAVPVAARETCQDLQREVDEIICLRTPEPFQAVGLWYEDFDQTSDDEVQRLLRESQKPEARS